MSEAAGFYVAPVTLSVAREGVREWHSHHVPPTGHKLSVGGFLGDSLVAVVIWSRPVAPALCDGLTWEVTRLAVGPAAPRYAASRLLGATTSAVLKMGVRRCVSYTRVDERGTCYRAANWHPTIRTPGREWTSGNKSTRWLPGLYEPSTEIVDRVRWERGPDAAPANWSLVAEAA